MNLEDVDDLGSILQEFKDAVNAKDEKTFLDKLSELSTEARRKREIWEKEKHNPDAICECGHVYKAEEVNDHQCPSCGAANFIPIESFLEKVRKYSVTFVQRRMATANVMNEFVGFCKAQLNEELEG